MTRMGFGGLGAFVAIAASLAAVTAPIAAGYSPEGLPEVGHCVKVARGTGEYTAVQCVHSTKANGTGDWHAAKGSEHLTFSGKGGVTTLTTHGNPAWSVSCTTVKIAGEWLAPRAAVVTLTLQGCTNGLAAQCQSGFTSGEIKSSELPTELGFIRNQIKNGKPSVLVGISMRSEATAGDLFGFNCGNLLETAKVEGAVVAQIKPFDSMTTASNINLSTNVKGKQQYEKFEGEPSNPLVTSISSGLETTTLPATLGIQPKTESGTNPSKLEIKGELIEG